MRVGFTLLIASSSVHGVTLPLLLTPSIIGESLECEPPFLCHKLARGFHFLQGAFSQAGSVFSSAPDFILTGKSFYPAIIINFQLLFLV